MVSRIELLVAHYRRMLLIRRVEEESARAYAQGKIGGFLHLYIGQEAVAVGACAAIEPSDYVVGTYRDHGLAIAKGVPARQVMAELYGKVTGCSKGLGGSMHMFDRERNMLGGWGIVGGHIPIAVGTAFASKYRSDGRITLCFFGEGAVSIGDFHEALSLAGLFKLPIVFICENNEYSMGTPLSRTIAVEDVSLKASGYAVARDRVFVTDVIELGEHVAEAVARARSAGEPTLIEARTYRFRGHSMSDPGKYRSAQELEDKKKNDPLTRARVEIEASGSASQLAEIDVSVEREVEDAVAFADQSPEPGRDLLEPATYLGPFAR
jgi:pyruvate dehydrogenase E1 component alpha subunit